MPWKSSKSFDLSPQKEISGGKLDQLPLMDSTEPSGISTPPLSGSISTPSKKRHERRSSKKSQEKSPKPSTEESPDKSHITTVKIDPPSLSIPLKGEAPEPPSPGGVQSPSINYEKNKCVRIVVGDQQVSYELSNGKRRSKRYSGRGDRDKGVDIHQLDFSTQGDNEDASWSAGVDQVTPNELELDKNSKVVNSWKSCNGNTGYYLEHPFPIEDCQRSTSTLVTNKSSKFSSSSENQRGFVSLSCGIGIVVGSAVCLRLPGLLLTYGAGNFLLAFFVSMLAIAVPMAYLEAGLGQFSNSSVIGMWSLVPLARGIGWSAVTGCLYWGAATVGMASPWLHYIIAQFRPSALQEKNEVCAQFFNTTSFDSLNYYRFCVYNMTSADLAEYDFSLTWTLPAGLVIILTISSISVAGGPVFLACVSGISAVLALLGYSAQLILGVTEMVKDDKQFLSSALHQFMEFLLPDLEVLAKPQVWLAAVSQALLSLGPGIGLLLNHASSNIFRYPLRRHLWFLTIVTLMTTLIVSVTTLMHLAAYTYTQVDEGTSDLNRRTIFQAHSAFETENRIAEQTSFASHKPSLISREQIELGFAEGFPFIATSRLLWMVSGSKTLFTVSYFLIFLGFMGAGLCTACACLHVGVVAAKEAKSVHSAVAAVLLMILLSLIAAPTATQAGPSLIYILDYYVLSPGMLWAPLAATVALALFHGMKKIRKDLTFMLESQLCVLWLPIWSLVLPLLLLGLTLWLFITQWDEFGILGGQAWKAIAVWSLRMVLLLPIPIAAIVVINSQLAYGLKDKILSSLQSSREWGEWGPKDPIEHHNWRQWKEDETLSYASLDRRLAAKSRPLTYTHSTLSSTGSSTLNRIRAKYSNGNAATPSKL